MSEDKQDKEPVLYDNGEERVKNPAIWLAIAAIPLMLGLLLGFIRGEKAFERPPEPVRVVPEDTGGRRIGPVSGNIPIIAQAIETAQQDGQGAQENAQGAAPGLEAPPCNFEAWVGLKVQEDMLQAIKDAKRPFRILPPGSMMTMDHAPARINFDTDDAGNITRVWCG